MSSDRHFIWRSLLVGAGTMTSRLLGLLREALTANCFGAGKALDLFLMAFTVPNLFRRVFGEGALRDAFLPVFGRELADPAGQPARMFNIVLTLLSAALWAAVLIGWAACAAAWRFADLGEDGKRFCLLLAVMLPYLPLICLSALQTAALNQKGRFFVPALVPSLLNVCWVAALLIWRDRRGVEVMAWAVVVSGALQCAAQVPLLIRLGLSPRVIWDTAYPGLRRMLALMGPVALAGGVFQLNVLADRLIAWFCVSGEGAVSVLNYANRLVQLPLGVLGIALTTAAFPSFVDDIARDGKDRMLTTANLAMRTAFFLSIPCAAGLIVFAGPIVHVLFQHGRFAANPDAAARMARALACYTLGLWAVCAAPVTVRVFYAAERARGPVGMSLAMVAVNLVLNLILVWPLRESGLALASSITAALNLAGLLCLMRGRYGRIGARAILRGLLKCLAAAVLAGLAARQAHRALAGSAAVSDILVRLLARLRLPAALFPRASSLAFLLAGLGILAIAYLAAVRLMGSRELREFADGLRRRSRES